MRLRLLLCACLALAGCKKFFSFGNPDAGGGRGGGGGGGLSSMLASLVGFEGEIDMAISMPSVGTVGMPMTVTMKLKGDRMRMEIGMPGALGGSLGATIMDGGKKKSWTLVPTTKQYTETDLDAAKPTSGPPATKPIITKSGRTDKVAGYSCDIVTMSEAGKRERTEFCMSKGLTFLGMGMGPFSGMGGSEYGDLMKEGFPLRMQSFDASGAEIMKMEATRIEKKSEPDSEFEVPAGWTKMGSPYVGPAPTATPTTGSGGGYTF